MEFRILGPLEVLEEGQLLSLGGPRQRTVLAILALHPNEVVSRNRLMDELWGDSPPETAQTAVQVYISQLRKALGADRIETRPPGYLLRVGPEELDVVRFERMVEEARGAPPADAAERLRQALAVWRGRPLADLGDGLARPDRARLEEERMAAVELRIAADLELGRHEALVAEVERLVRDHPLRERLRGQLMVALYRSGRQADALEVYRTGRRLLAEELGLEPGEELRRLEKAILEQDPALAVAEVHPPARAAAMPTGTVTFLFTDIEGSTRLVKDLGEDYGQLLEQHHALLRQAFTEHGGQEIDSQGDAFFFAFRRAREAVRAAVFGQLAFGGTQWPRGTEVRIRIGIHTGEPPGLVDGGYHGLDVVRAARISGTARGGQILVSSATRDLVGDALPDVSFRDLGPHSLKDIDQAQRLFQVLAPGLREDFPPPRTEDAARVMAIGGRAEELAVAAEAALEAEERRLRLSRRSRIAVVLGALLLAGATAGVVVALTSGAEGSVAVAPNSVAVVDPETNRVTHDVLVGQRPVAVAVGEGAVWVANADEGTVQRIDPETRKVVATIGLGGEVSDLAVGYGAVWVAGGNDETLTRIDPRHNAVEATLRFAPLDPLDPQPMFAVTAGAGAVWVTRGNRVLRVDPDTNEATNTIPVDQPLALTVGAGALWITTLTERILRVEPRTAAITATIPIPAQAWGPAAGGAALWAIVGIGGGEIWRFDANTGSPNGTLRTGAAPTELALDGRTLWAANLGGGGSVSRIDAAEGDLLATVPVGQPPTAVASGEGAVWVAVESAAT